MTGPDRRQCRRDDALQQFTLRPGSRENADAQQHSQQLIRNLVSARRSLQVPARHHPTKATQQKSTNGLQVSSYHLRHHPVVRRNLQRGVDEKATASLPIAERSLDHRLEKSRQRIGRRIFSFDPVEQRVGTRTAIMLQCLDVELPLVAKCIVEARAGETHRVSQLAHRCGFVAVTPKAGHRGLEHFGLLEQAWAWQSDLQRTLAAALDSRGQLSSSRYTLRQGDPGRIPISKPTILSEAATSSTRRAVRPEAPPREVRR